MSKKQIKTRMADVVQPVAMPDDGVFARFFFGDVYWVEGDNLGRYVSGPIAADSPERKILVQSIALVGLVATKGTMITCTVPDADDIEYELQRRQDVIDSAKLAAKANTDKKKQPLLDAMVAVAEYYYSTKTGEIRVPTVKGWTGNQRAGAYLDAMAVRYAAVRANGYSSNVYHMEPLPNRDPKTVTPEEVCQNGIPVLYYDHRLTDAQIQHIQLDENQEKTNGTTYITSLDRAYTAWQEWVRRGQPMKEVETAAYCGLSKNRGVGQHVQRICAVEWALRGNKQGYSVIERMTLLQNDPEYRNPLIWASPSYSAEFPKQITAILATFDPVKLAAINAKREVEKLSPQAPWTQEELIAKLEKCDKEAKNAELPPTPMSWKLVEETVTADKLDLFTSFVRACRNDSYDIWKARNAHLLQQIQEMTVAFEAEMESAELADDDSEPTAETADQPVEQETAETV